MFVLQEFRVVSIDDVMMKVIWYVCGRCDCIKKGKQNAVFSSVGELQPCLMCRKLKFDEVNLAKTKLFWEMLTEWDSSE